MSTAITRRSLVKGAAWAAPAVLTTATVPAYAASEDYCSTTLLTPGSAYGKFQLSFSTDIERLYVYTAPGTILDVATFSKINWHITSDKKVAYWIPNTMPGTRATFNLGVIPDTSGSVPSFEVSVDVVDNGGCPPITYDGNTVERG